MSITRRADQRLESRGPGVNRLVMTGPSTGATMLSVNDLTMAPGSKIPYHVHPNTEESMYVAEGELIAALDGKRFRFTKGDCMVAAQGKGHGFQNNSDAPARMITMYPSVSPEMTPADDSDLQDGRPQGGVTFRREAVPYEFFPGVARYDMVGDFTGAASSYLSELVFEPGAVATNHYHPAHEESMFCLDGGLTAVYGDQKDVPLSAGDMFTCEMRVTHGVFCKEWHRRRYAHSLSPRPKPATASRRRLAAIQRPIFPLVWGRPCTHCRPSRWDRLYNPLGGYRLRMLPASAAVNRLVHR